MGVLSNIFGGTKIGGYNPDLSGYDTAVKRAEKFKGEPTGLRQHTGYDLSALDKQMNKAESAARPSAGGATNTRGLVNRFQQMADMSRKGGEGYLQEATGVKGTDLAQQSDRSYDVMANVIPGLIDEREEKRTGVEIANRQAQANRRKEKTGMLLSGGMTLMGSYFGGAKEPSGAGGAGGGG